MIISFHLWNKYFHWHTSLLPPQPRDFSNFSSNHHYLLYKLATSPQNSPEVRLGSGTSVMDIKSSSFGITLPGIEFWQVITLLCASVSLSVKWISWCNDWFFWEETWSLKNYYFFCLKIHICLSQSCLFFVQENMSGCFFILGVPGIPKRLGS